MTATPTAVEALRQLVDVLWRRHHGRMPDEVRLAVEAGEAALATPASVSVEQERAGNNIGHGWVRPRADGAKARCDGHNMCPVCMREAASAQGAPTPKADPTRSIWEPRPDVAGDYKLQAGSLERAPKAEQEAP